MKRHLALALLCLAPLAASFADAPATQPQAVAVVAPPPFDKETGEWLDKIEAKTKEVQSLQADIVYDRTQALVNDRQRRFGRMFYLPGPPARFSVHFTKLLIGDRMDKQERWYIFDGKWLLEKLTDRKQFMKRQIVAPDAPPEQANPLEMGGGPFKIPVSLHKDRLAKRFTVTVAENGEDDPSNTIRLHFVPRPGLRMDFSQIDIWYDRDTLLPQRFLSLDESKNISQIDLKKIQINQAIDPTVLDTCEPEEKDWLIQVTPWKE